MRVPHGGKVEREIGQKRHDLYGDPEECRKDLIERISEIGKARTCAVRVKKGRERKCEYFV